MDVTDSKTIAGAKLTVSLSAEDIAALQQGQALTMTDPETKYLFEVRAQARLDRTFECGLTVFQLFASAFTGRMRIVDEDTFAHDLPGGAGSLTFRYIGEGKKGTSDTTFTLTTVELVP